MLFLLQIMWRCYEPAFYGSEDAEGTKGDQMYDEQSGVAIFVRAPFPGLPFIGAFAAGYEMRHVFCPTSTLVMHCAFAMPVVRLTSLLYLSTCPFGFLLLSPSAENEFQEEDDEEPVVMCTPALRNAAPGTVPAAAAVALAVLAAAAVAVAAGR